MAKVDFQWSNQDIIHIGLIHISNKSDILFEIFLVALRVLYLRNLASPSKTSPWYEEFPTT